MAKYENRNWVKTVKDDQWKRHTIAPPRQERKHGSWIGIALIVAAVGGFMAYGMLAIDDKHGTPDARVVWVPSE